MDDEAKKREEKAKDGRIRISILLIVCAALVFWLLDRYTAQPISVYNIQASPSSAVQTVSQPVSEDPSAEESENPEELEDRLPEKSVDINSAGPEELKRLPGIGSVLAGRIVEYREEYGNFLEIEELMEVNGIGEKIFEKIEPYIVAK